MKRTGIFIAALFLLAAGSAAEAKAQDRVIGEEIVAVVGNSMVLWSDVVEAMNGMAEQQRQRGFTSNRNPQSEALEMLLMQRLLTNQARLDSLETNVGQIENLVENQINQLMDRYGSMRALEEVYRKPVYQIRDDLRERYTDMMLAQTMEYTVKGKTTVIPSEVERFYRRISRDSLPMVPEQYVYAQIVMYPPSLDEAKLRARERLLELRERIINGESFRGLAVAYSVDPGSAMRGGEYDFMPKDGLQRPFGEALERLRVGQVSPVVETEDGFHIIELLEKRNDQYRFRHILIKPEYTPEEMSVTAIRLDSIAQVIRSGDMTFEAAALEFSQDNYSKYNGGEVTNREIVELMGEQARQTSNRFNREDLFGDYNAIRTLKPGEISPSYQTQDLRGNQQVKIVLLKEIVPSHRANINEDYGLIEDMALEDKKNREYAEWLNKKIAAMYIKVDPKYAGGDFENKGWIK